MKRLKGQLKKNVIDQYEKQKNVLLLPEHFENDWECDHGDLIEISADHRYIATAYYGLQNKGIGWVLSHNEQEAINKQFFERQIHKAFYERESLFADSDITAFRIFNGEGDGIGGLTIDYYDGYFLVTIYSEGMYRYKDWILESLLGLRHLEMVGFTDVYGIYQKRRFDDGGKYIDEPSFIWGKEAPAPLIVLENGIQYATYLDDGAMTGIFLDQKDVRRTIKEVYAKDKDVLNTFSYTGAFSVAAAIGSAKSTTSVDLAKRSLQKTKEQFQVNGIDLEHNQIVVMDVFDYFKWAIKKEKQFDLIILDPPAFAKSKKMVFTVIKNYTWLMENAIDLIKDQGVIIASTNSAHLSMKKFKKQIEVAVKYKGFKYEVLDIFTLPEDFKSHEGYTKGNYLKVLFIKIIK